MVPVIAAFGGVAFLSEQLSVRLIATSALVLGGMALAVIKRKPMADPNSGANLATEQIEAELADPASTFLLAHEEGEAIGYAMLRDGKSPIPVNGPRPVELVRINVEREAIGKGYGLALMNACLVTAEGNGNRTIWLGVWERNEQAIGFFEKWGFAKVGVKEFVLGSDLQTDLIMERPVEFAA